jgi:thiamine-monophosphate kinase
MAARARGRGPVVREREFHARLARRLPAGRTGILPLGDDAAALRPGRHDVAVVSTDTLVEGDHFVAASDAGRIGEAAAAVSLSDIAAKGARPVGILLNLVLPPRTERRWAEAVVLGAERMGARFGAHVVGGDTKEGPVRAVASTVVGFGRVAALAPRTSARAGDLLVTTGVVGAGGLAARRFERRHDRRSLNDLLWVRPRVREGRQLGPLADAMLDTSDGIADSAILLARASRVRVVVEEGALPYAPGLVRATGSEEDRRAVAFYGGDYELLAALPSRRWARAERQVRRVGGRLTRVGRVERGRGAWLEVDGRTRPMPPAGWQHFGAPGGPAVAVRPGAVRRRRRVRATLK